MGVTATLAFCAVITLVCVCTAAYVTILGAVACYQWQQETRRRLDQAPRELTAAIDKAVAEFVAPYREMQSGKVEPIKPTAEDIFSNDKELYEWLSS